MSCATPTDQLQVDKSARLFVCRFSNGQYVGNLISSAGSKSFVSVGLKDACQFYSRDDAFRLATEHGATNFSVFQL